MKMRMMKLSLWFLSTLFATYTPNFAMEEQLEGSNGKESSLFSHFETVTEKDFFPFIPELLKQKLNQSVNHEKFLNCPLTKDDATNIISLLNTQATPREIFNQVRTYKTICESNNAEGTLTRNMLPENVIYDPLMTPLLFQAFGVKYNYSWDLAEILLRAHKDSLPMKIDPKVNELIPLVLTQEELTDYQNHHDLRMAIHGFYNDYVKLLNAQSRIQGELPIYNETNVKEDQSPPMTEKEKQQMMLTAKERVENWLEQKQKERAFMSDDLRDYLKKLKRENVLEIVRRNEEQENLKKNKDDEALDESLAKIDRDEALDKSLEKIDRKDHVKNHI